MRNSVIAAAGPAAALALAPVGAGAQGVVGEPGLADVNGAQIEYVISGPTDGEPVLLLHGAGLADALAPVAADPALAEYRLIRMHRRGYAGSSEIAGETFSIEQQAADALALLDALDIDTAHVAGHSYGGAVALQMAEDAPERLAGLLLIDSAPPPDALPPPPPGADGAPAPDPIAELGRQAGERLAEGDAEGAVGAFFTGVFGADWRDYFTAVPGGLEQAVADVDTMLGFEGQAMGAWLAVPFDSGALEPPILVMWGEDSIAAGPQTEAMLAAMPGAGTAMIPGTDHALIVQKPDAVAEAMAAFLAEHPM